LKGEAMF